MQRDRTQTHSDEDSRAGATSRGQTNLDFAIGISLFLGVIIFIFLFVPGLLSPFTATAQAQTVTADRAVDHLTKSVLGSPRSPYSLRTDCTVQFFNEQDACGFEQAPVAEQLGLDPATQNVNVTVVGNASTTATARDTLCWDNTDDSLVAATACPNADTNANVILTRGQPVPADNEATVTALRVVWVAGEDVTVVVEVW
ncbi:hypothetical protein Har1130_05210 [Haloarcula sp. CBA1130]|uniref:DUF7287 family protein n=1 Tax=unclassified Haloarcula TaxID=2624677 RepID=UPI001244FA7A|nr:MULTISPECIES: hypothetical protein [unclassified Haloarcula]KAA9398146.1 hypothetical protein Har1129_07930 [Haloarcula sp. CBA1129]KAA9402167.1 hypothetical protein Har1130_05210 [Haloarcula sp. CBA1130]